MSRANEILKFWFGDDDFPSKEMRTLWWSKDPELSQAIKNKFEQDVEYVLTGKYDDWLNEPQGRLAIIILLDQFCRNIYRDSPKAFANDKLSLQFALDGIEQRHDKKLSYFGRAFFYMPLEHAEDKDLQRRCVELFAQLYRECPADIKENIKGFLNYAKAHQVIIDRFGRFPHRNVILNRASTDEELEFLKQPHSRF